MVVINTKKGFSSPLTKRAETIINKKIIIYYYYETHKYIGNSVMLTGVV